MYKKNSHSWLKHSDFILLDCVCQQIAFIIAYLIRHGFTNPYKSPLYYKMALFAFVSNLAVAFFNESYANVVKRGYYIEFVKTMKHSSLVEGMFVLFLFFMKRAVDIRALYFLQHGLYMFLYHIWFVLRGSII